MKHEFFRDVQDVVAQPCRIEYLNPVSGRQNTYTPDFLVYYRWGRGHLDLETRPMLVEVKPAFAWKRHWREWAPKWKAARRYAEQQGMVFRIHDESRIRTAALENIRFLERFKDREYPLEVTEAVIETVREMGCVPYHYLLARFFMGIYRAEGIGHLWHLVATGHLQCDIYEPLSEFTELWVESNG